MSNLPKTIVVVTLKHSNKYSQLRKIYKKFFEGLPHIVYTDCNLDSKNIYYIFTATYLVSTFISTLYDETDTYIPDILGYGIYDYTEICSLILHTYMPCYYTYTLNPKLLPASVKINPNDVKKLESLKKD